MKSQLKLSNNDFLFEKYYIFDIQGLTDAKFVGTVIL